MKTTFSTTLAVLTLVIAAVSISTAQEVYNYDDSETYNYDESTGDSGNVGFTPGGSMGFTPPQPNYRPNPHFRPHHNRRPSQPRLGFRGRMIYGEGILIEALQPGGQAERMGVDVGDVITHIGPNQSEMIRIQSFEQYLELLQEMAQYNQGRVVMQLQNNNPWGGASPTVTVRFRLQSGSSGSHFGSQLP